MRTLVAAAALAAIGFFGAALGVSAQDVAGAPDVSASVDSVISDICSGNGAVLRWLVGLLGTSVVGSLLANFAHKMPGGVAFLLNALALNFSASLRAAASKAAGLVGVLLLASSLVACAGVAPSVPPVAGDAAASVAPSSATKTDPAAVVAEGFKLACYSVSIADGFFKGAAPALMFSGALPPNALELEQGEFVGLQALCDNPPADPAAAVSQLTGWAGGLYIAVAKAQRGA